MFDAGGNAVFTGDVLLLDIVVGVVIGNVGNVGVISYPIEAKGFGLPSCSAVRGVSEMLESCKLVKAGLEKMESSNFMLLTLNKTERKLLAMEEF
jgi:hypothetical protein